MTNDGDFPKDGNVWDLMFYILSKENADFMDANHLNWKDIEDMMRVVLVGESTTIPYSFGNIVNKKNLEHPQSKNIVRYLENKCNINDVEETYEFIYQDLLRFENVFSNFLKEQEKDPVYNENARKMFSESGLLKMTDSALVSIDTFNYTTPEVFSELPGKISIRHINGKIGSAIFGIDTHGINVDDPTYRFTKTARKMLDLIEGGREEFKRGFKNIVIYGHSLAQADYSYFYSILDAIDLMNFKEYKSRLIVAFSNYSDNEEVNKKNRRNISESLTRMLSGYDRWINPSSPRQGIVEMLETSDRVGFAVVDTSILSNA